jgi:hypothetical protein
MAFMPLVTLALTAAEIAPHDLPHRVNLFFGAVCVGVLVPTEHVPVVAPGTSGP